ncbi:hypothetical protein VTO42DRAFT_8559 [Malbranchea cinnamomea]
MTSQLHTYGPTCLLYEPESQPSTCQDPNIIPPPPPVRAQFFYISPFPVDDPLSPLPTPSSSSATSQAKLPPRPFSARDNIALEEAWQSLRKKVGELKARRRVIPGSHSYRQHSRGSNANASRQGRRSDDIDSEIPALAEFQGSTSDFSRETSPPRSLRGGVVGKNDSRGDGRVPAAIDVDDIAQKRRSMPIPRTSKSPKHYRTSSPGGEEGGSHVETGPSTPRTGQHSTNTSVSGSPFIRAPIRHKRTPLSDSRISKSDQGLTAPSPERPVSPSLTDKMLSKDHALERNKQQSRSRSSSEAMENEIEASVTVGASRLHQVELPKLQMKPIYWSPLHDVAPVLRATWFYKNTMLPVDPDVANQLEAGYMYLKPWTQTWQEELNSCVENGAEAELKIVHKLWPNENVKTSHTAQNNESHPARFSSDTRHEQLDYENNQAAASTDWKRDSSSQFKNSSVIYVDATDAQILRPSLLPSVSRGRRPLSSIRKGRQIGIAVVRGFNRRMWDKLHPTKLPSTSARYFMKMHQSGLSNAMSGPQQCFACQMEDRKPNVNDLVLVIHGIGQKLSERVESFHFTHAVNALRRQVNIELCSNALSPYMRPEVESIMVLPVNWRSTLSLEDTDVEETLSEDLGENRFALKDITPETIPAVRNLISDVMLDIPYYLSHHKPKMVRAVIREANRIYRLWCRNNPGFKENGRVHLIAHSLGSVMALDILSNQPTIPPSIDFDDTEISHTVFEFDTKNLFLCGSPAGFFLLLNKANLLPRKGRNKPGTSNEDAARGIAGEAGTYGCLAVDNIYNIMHETDPIAYRLNAAVDVDLANSLRPASIPTSSTSFLQAMGSVFRWSSPKPPLISATTHPTRVQQHPNIISKLPSNIELETHDFTREEIAETRMQLLNDNGQIDYFISGGGGPLNIQYLNMLSAHSSYWVLPDFVRFLVIEIGRAQGKDGTLLALRAVKKKGWKRKV